MLPTVAAAQHIWQNFYSVLGGSAATLIGLTFVMVSLGVRIITEESTWRVHVFITPLIAHLAAVLVVCLLILAPTQPRPFLALEVATMGIAGLAYLASLIPGFLRLRAEGMSTYAWKIFGYYLPTACYVGVLGGGVTMVTRINCGLWATAAALTVLVCVTIRNTWFSTLTVAAKSPTPDAPEPPRIIHRRIVITSSRRRLGTPPKSKE